MEKLTCDKAKRLDLVDYLAALGYQPKKIRNKDYWYLSPLREERTPSFKINRERNVWYDHATGKGGDLIEFGTLYFNCTVSKLLQKLSQQSSATFSFHPHPALALAGEKEVVDTKSKVIICDSRPISDPGLLAYLENRYISLAVCGRVCKEVDFLLYGKKYTAIGFQNNAGGYELRSPDFKGSSAPKATTFIDNGARSLTVFEGFFNYLSYLQTHKDTRGLTNFLVLNSLAFFEKSRSLMEQHGQVKLYLDRDKAGMACVQEAVKWNPHLYKDQSQLYSNYKDLNDWLVYNPTEVKHRQKIKRSF